MCDLSAAMVDSRSTEQALGIRTRASSSPSTGDCTTVALLSGIVACMNSTSFCAEFRPARNLTMDWPPFAVHDTTLVSGSNTRTHRPEVRLEREIASSVTEEDIDIPRAVGSPAPDTIAQQAGESDQTVYFFVWEDPNRFSNTSGASFSIFKIPHSLQNELSVF